MTWEELEDLFDIKFKLADGNFRPVNEWLDDIYLKMNREDLRKMMKVILNHAELFEDLVEHKK